MSSQTTPPTPANHFNLFRWDNTECLLQTEIIAPKRPLPASATHPNSLLVDCKESKANDLQIVEYFKDVLIGVNPRPDLQFLQLFFASESIAKDILDKGPPPYQQPHPSPLPSPGHPAQTYSYETGQRTHWPQRRNPFSLERCSVPNNMYHRQSPPHLQKHLYHDHKMAPSS